VKNIMSLIVFAVLLSAASGHAAPVNEQLYFYKATTGLTVPATYTFRFSLWDAASAGTEIWWEKKNVSMTSATLATYLGSVTNTDNRSDRLANLDFSEQYWVQIEKLETDGVTWSPVGSRTKLTVVPYAMYSVASETAASGGSVPSVTAGDGMTSVVSVGGDVTLKIGAGPGISVDADKVSIANGGVTSAMLAPGAVTSGKIKADAVTTAKIADGAVTAPKIGISCPDGNFLKYKTNEGWICGPPGNPIYRCELCDLSGQDLSNNNLSYAQLSHANLSSAKLVRSLLAWARLDTANLSGADLTGVIMDSCNATHADFRGATLGGASMKECTAQFALFNDTSVWINARSVDFYNADFSGANLGGDFRQTSFNSANFTGATISQSAIFDNKTYFQYAVFNGADMHGVALRLGNNALWHSTFIGANLQQATFHLNYDSNLDFSTSNLSGATLSGSMAFDPIFTQANMQGANLSWWCSLFSSSGESCGGNFAGADLRGANLTAAYLKGAVMTGIIQDDTTNWTIATCPNGQLSTGAQYGCGQF
jgi:uncharacterized protein YjbI with pentapeptide repeats